MRPVDPAIWITPKQLAESTVANISTAALHSRWDASFSPGAADEVDFALMPV
jgi:hypothetical protein